MVKDHAFLAFRPGYLRILSGFPQLAGTEKLRVSFTGLTLADELVKSGERIHHTHRPALALIQIHNRQIDRPTSEPINISSAGR